MKSKIFISIFALTLILSLTGCGENTNGNNSDNMMSDIQSGMQSAGDKVESGMDNAGQKLENGMDSMDAKISRDKAKQIALEDAKVKESDIKNYSINLDTDDGVQEYDIEFDVGGTEYDYEIDANTGDIRERNQDKID